MEPMSSVDYFLLCRNSAPYSERLSLSSLAMYRREAMESSHPETPPSALTASNIGFRLLQKAGWREGVGLGAAEQGRLEPLDLSIKTDKRGLGAKVVSQKMAIVSRRAHETRKPGLEGKVKHAISKKALKNLKKEADAERKSQQQQLQRDLFMAFWPDNV